MTKHQIRIKAELKELLMRLLVHFPDAEAVLELLVDEAWEEAYVRVRKLGLEMVH